MIKKALSTTIEPIAYAILFFLTIRRISWVGYTSLEEHAFQITYPEIILWVLVLALFLWIARSKSIFPVMISTWKKNWIFPLFILFAVFSILWSMNFPVTIYKVIVLVGCSAVAAYTGVAYKGKSLFQGFWWFSAIVAISTFLVAVFFPPIGTHIGYPYFGAWRGIFMSKNYMGPIMALGNLVFLFSLSSSGKGLFPRLGDILLYILTALLVFLSKCATAVILLVVLNLGFILAVAWVKWKKYLRKAHYIAL